MPSSKTSSPQTPLAMATKRMSILMLLAALATLLSGRLLAAGNQADGGYRSLLDSAALCEREGRYREAAGYYARGFDAYKQHYTRQMESINRQLAYTYNVDKKEQELAHLSEALQLKKKQTVLLSVLAAILLAALLLFFFLQKYRLRSIRRQRLQKENETSRLKLEKEQKEMEAQLNTLQAEKIRKEWMAGALLVEYKNKVMEEFRQLFAQHAGLGKYRAALEEIVQTEEASGENAAASHLLQQIHPAFCERLQQQASNKLTPLDLKYCRMIYLKMSSKEMAALLQVEPRTIRVTKHRLKQKLGLPKETDLGSFIDGMG